MSRIVQLKAWRSNPISILHSPLVFFKEKKKFLILLRRRWKTMARGNEYHLNNQR